MSTLVIIFALLGILGVLGLLLSGIVKPAMEPLRGHRGPAAARRRVRSTDRDTNAQTPAWRRALSFFELACLTVVVGITAAAIIGAIAVVVGSFLTSAI